MSISWLANTDPKTAWAHHAWPEFSATPEVARTLVVLPVHGFADHGLGLPLDAEEILGAALLRDAANSVNQDSENKITLKILPPLRFGLAPYPSTFLGIDPETAHEQLREIATSVRAAGFSKLVFLVTSPWHEDWIDAASRDIRVELGLQTFVINLSGLALDFHPASENRAQARAAVSHLLGRPAAPVTIPADIRDADFRPGNHRQPAPLPPTPTLDGAALAAKAARHLARLLGEIDARAPLHKHAGDHRPAHGHAHTPAPPPSPKPKPAAAETSAAAPQLHFPDTYRARYLPAFTREELDALPDKDRTLVILPTGAIEQHGHHLPVGVDSILGQAWLAQALPKLPAAARVLVAPPITYGKSNEHTGFPGTVFISAKTLRRLVRALAAQLHALGFRHLALLNTHGGNSAVLVYTLRELQTELGLRAGMLNFPYKPGLDPQEAEYGFHGGEWETSLMLGCAPELVRMDKAVCEYPARIDDPGELRPENAPAIFSWITADISTTGVMGDATRATREKGLRWLDLASTALARRIQELLP
jgi:creatinine amidohydrolase